MSRGFGGLVNIKFAGFNTHASLIHHRVAGLWCFHSYLRYCLVGRLRRWRHWLSNRFWLRLDDFLLLRLLNFFEFGSFNAYRALSRIEDLCLFCFFFLRFLLKPNLFHTLLLLLCWGALFLKKINGHLLVGLSIAVFLLMIKAVFIVVLGNDLESA